MCNKQKYSTKNDKSHDITIFNENQRTKLIIFIIFMYLFIVLFILKLQFQKTTIYRYGTY